jgi:hypothetical protein
MFSGRKTLAYIALVTVMKKKFEKKNFDDRPNIIKLFYVSNLRKFVFS